MTDTLAGGGGTAVCGLDRPQESVLLTDYKTLELPPGPVVPVFWAVKLHPPLPSWIPEHQARCPLSSVSLGELTGSSDTILSPACLKVAAVPWKIESLVRRAQASELDPGNGPPNRLFLPSSAVVPSASLCLSPWRESHPVPPEAALLVANNGRRHTVCVCSGQVLPPTPC